MRERLLIADDHELMLAGIAQILASEFDIVGLARNGRTLLAEAKRLSPDIIVLDLGMPELNGVEATRQIMAMLPNTRMIVLTQQLSSSHVNAAFRAGARGYVAKQAAATELIEAARAVLLGRYYITSLAIPKEAIGTTGGAMDKNPAELFGDTLTPKQREVLALVARGKSAKEIASALNISINTVDFYRGILMDELGLKTTPELTHYAITNGIVNESVNKS